MKMSKRMKAAITVAAIAGTCALASPSFAAWESAELGALSKNMNSISSDKDFSGSNNDLVAVGDDGKVYYISGDDMVTANPTWTKVLLDESSNFIGVDNDGDTFVAVAADGSLWKTDDPESNSWTEIATTAASYTGVKAIIESGNIQGLCCYQNDKIAIVTKDCKIVLYDTDSNNWMDISGSVSSAKLAADGENRVKGIAFNNSKFIVFGASDADGADANLISYNTIDGMTEYKIAHIDTINAVHFCNTNTYMAGNKGAVVRATTNNLGVVATDLTTGIAGWDATINFNDITYNETQKYGYVAGDSGTVYHIGETTADPVLVKSDVSAATSKTLNSLAPVIDADTSLYRTFAVGEDGASIFNDEGYWKAVGGENAPTAPCAVAAGEDGEIFVFENDSMKVSKKPGETWYTGANAGSPGIPNGASTVYHKQAADNIYLFASGNAEADGRESRKIIAYKWDGAGIVTGIDLDGLQKRKAQYIAKVGASTLVVAPFYGNHKIVTLDLSKAPLDAAATEAPILLDSTGSSAFSNAAGTTNGFYATPGSRTVSNIKTLVSTSADATQNKIRTDFNEANNRGYVAATGLTAIGDTLLPDDEVRLASTTDGMLIIMVETEGRLKIVVVRDTADSDVTKGASFGRSDLGYPAGVTNKPVKAWGTLANMFMTDGTDVYHYTGSWSKVASVAEVAGMDNLTGVVGYGSENAFAIDADKAAFSGSASFKAATDSDFDISGNVNAVFNATSGSFYVGGQDGLLVRGTYDSGTVTWMENPTRYPDFGNRDINKISGGSTDTVSNVFVSYGRYGREFAYKTEEADSWTIIEKAKLNGINSVTGVNDIQGVSATLLFVADKNHAGLVKAELNAVAGDEITFTQQSHKDGVEVANQMPEELTAISALDAEHIYGVHGNKLYKFTSPEDNKWQINQIELTDIAGGDSLNDVVAIAADKVFAVGASGLVYSYTGTGAASKLASPSETNPALKSCWAYEDMLYASAADGKVYAYNFKEKAWSVGELASGKNILDVTGSQHSGYLLAVGDTGTCFVTEINSSGGGEGDGSVTPGVGEDGTLVQVSTPHTVTPATLASTYKTPEDIEVVGKEQVFTSKPGLAPGSVHNFKFSVTPTQSIAVNDLVLYKLKTEGGENTNITFSRVDSVPTSKTDGVFWISEGGTVKGAGSTLNAGTVYTVNMGIEDGGRYDTNPAPGQISDPTVLSASTTGSGSGSGCVFNPSAGFGLEWFMLAFAPVAAFFRSRFKK